MISRNPILAVLVLGMALIQMILLGAAFVLVAVAPSGCSSDDTWVWAPAADAVPPPASPTFDAEPCGPHDKTRTVVELRSASLYSRRSVMIGQARQEPGWSVGDDGATIETPFGDTMSFSGDTEWLRSCRPATIPGVRRLLVEQSNVSRWMYSVGAPLDESFRLTSRPTRIMADTPVQWLILPLEGRGDEGLELSIPPGEGLGVDFFAMRVGDRIGVEVGGQSTLELWDVSGPTLDFSETAPTLDPGGTYYVHATETSPWNGGSFIDVGVTLAGETQGQMVATTTTGLITGALASEPLSGDDGGGPQGGGCPPLDPDLFGQDSCCNGSICLPPGTWDAPPELAAAAARCAGGGYCVPTDVLIHGEGYAAPSCTTQSGPGACLDICIPAVAENQAFLSQADCRDGTLCVPCSAGACEPLSCP